MNVKIRTISIVLITCLLVSVNVTAENEGKEPLLRIYLPREITVDSDTPSLGQVSIIQGEESLVAKASVIGLGRISKQDQKLVIDRPLILSRLASNGITVSEVSLTGADEVTVKQQHELIKSDKFVELARSFLEKNPPNGSICEFTPIRAPQELILPQACEFVKFSQHLVASGAANQAKVQIVVLADGKEIAVREVTFRLKYSCRQVVAAVDILRGTELSSENVKIEKAFSDYPEPANWSAPYGFVAKRDISSNTIIGANMVGPVKPEILIKRNQNVVITIEKGGLFVTAIGKAMQPGSVGEYIKVKNVDSERVILAKINEDGTVEPVF
jgi:flagellar basal body P-ring formation protein FlgA